MNFLQFAFFLLTAFFFSVTNAPAFHAPTEIAGIKLGSDIADLPDVQSSNYLKEVVVTDWHGFRKGIIYYGVCDSPGKIVKLRMKYENSSKKFFDQLLERHKKKFGSPTEWKGDSFGIKHVWKWKLADENGNIVNLILQHNLQDANENIGNVVKLSYPEREEIERLCFNRMCEEVGNTEEKKVREKRKESGWEYLIPK